MQTTRRKFLGSTAAGVAAVAIVPRHVLGGTKFVPPSEKVNIALVGAGGQGRSNVYSLFNEADVQVIAVADPIERADLSEFYYRGFSGRKPVQAEIEKHYAAKTPHYRCAAYEDFRVMLEKEPAIDAILCATPDHLHALVSVTAMRAGKHVYCEKPLTHNIWEARRVAQVAKETGLSTQMGNFGHSRDGIRRTCEWIWDGVIGPVRKVHAWTNAIRQNPHLTGRPRETPPVPAGVNWDLWLGPREPRPYHPAYTPVRWRDFWAFGSGSLGDFGCHDLDSAMWALDLSEPASIEATAAGVTSNELAPHGEICYFHFGPRGDKPPLDVTWYDGGLRPVSPQEMGPGRSLPDHGVLFVGDKGLLLTEGWAGPPRLLPFEKTHDYKKPPATLPRSKGHHRDWLDGCKGGPQPSANFAVWRKAHGAGPAGRLGGSPRGQETFLGWAKHEDRGAPEADVIIREQYRKGWELPA